MRNDIFPTEPCPNVIDPTPDGARAIPRRDESNRADREIARRAPDHNSLRAESRVKLKEPLLRLIRSISVLPAHANANGETEFSVLEVHNSYHQYIERYLEELPQNVRQRRIIPCDAILRDLYEAGTFNRCSLQIKWKMLALQFTTIDGVRAESGARVQLAEVRRVEDDEFDEEDLVPDTKSKNQENRHRAYIHSHLLEFENSITQFKKYSRAQIKQILNRRGSIKAISPEAEGRWTYIPPAERDMKSESEPESKKQKIELSPDEVCVICLEKKKTHAFLHANITKDGSAHLGACEDCANTVRWAEIGCPLCRSEVIATIKIL